MISLPKLCPSSIPMKAPRASRGHKVDPPRYPTVVRASSGASARTLRLAARSSSWSPRSWFRSSRARLGDSCELLQQRLGVPEIGGVKALGKPRVDVSQQVVRLPPFPLLVPEATQTHGGP